MNISYGGHLTHGSPVNFSGKIYQVHITVNKNTIPFETRSPFVTSGIRLGTSVVASRGLMQKDLQQVDRKDL